MDGGTDKPRWIAESSLFTEDSAMMYVVVGLMGTTNGVLAGAVGYFIDMTVLNLHAAIWFFLLGWATTTAYLSYKRVPSSVLAVGLYFIGLFVLLQPIVIYGPLVAKAGETSGTAQTQLLIDGWQGILWWGAIAGVLALAIMFTSRLLKRHARRVISRRMKSDPWHNADD